MRLLNGLVVAPVFWLALGLAQGRVVAACDPVGNIKFICGPISPEDLAVIPGDEWLIVSGDREGGRIHLINTRSKTATAVFPTASPRERLDKASYPSCPGPIDPSEGNAFNAHGLYLKKGSNKVHSLYVVHHGKRESIEIFDVDTNGAQPVLTWVGCVPAPEKVGFNAVVALPEGGVAATHARTGVWEWHGRSGWKIIPGSEDTVSNGIEISPDGQTLFINGWEEQKITRLSRGLTPVKKDVIKVPFRPDNIRWSPDGSLLYSSGMGNVQTPRELSVETSNVFQVDPKTLAIKRLFSHPYIPGFGAATTAVKIGNEMWLGTYRGEMIPYFPFPTPE
jgi:hypothetical protein